MSAEMIEKISNIDLTTILISIIFISTTSKWIHPWYLKLKGYIIKENDAKIKDQEIEDAVHETQGRMKKYEENRLHDREQSFKIQKQLVDSMEAINKRLDSIETKIEEDREAERKKTRAEIKEKMSQLYRYYHRVGKWTEMEKEAFEDLVTEYEDAGGYNSFVHDTVVPESYTWTIIPLEELKNIN